MSDAPSGEGDTVIVARFRYRHEGEFAKGYLEDAGIYSGLFLDDGGGIDPALIFIVPARLVVRAEDQEEARSVLTVAGFDLEV